MAKEYKKHSEIPAKYKWDLSFLLEGKTVQERIKEVIKLRKKLVEQKESKYSSKEAYLKFKKDDEKFTIKYLKLNNYLSNALSLNVVDPEINAHRQTLLFEMSKLNELEGAEDPLFFKNAANLSKWAKLKEFDEYRHSIESKLEEKKHQLPKAIQEYLVKTERGAISAYEPFSILTNSELVFEDAVDSKGKKHKLNQSNMSTYAESNDKKLRKSARDNYQKAYLRHKALLANLLYQQFKTWTVEAKVSKFKSPTEYLTFSDRVDDEFLQVLYNVTKKNVPLMKKQRAAHKKFYKAAFGETITKYDYGRKLISSNKKYDVDTSIKLVIEALKPFGKEYIDEVEKAFKENWVDFYPLPTKRGGAYSMGGSYGIDKKLILMNHNGTYGSVSTLAHEMGHSMHSYFSDKYNKFTNSFYPIFVAEVASIFNELMLDDYVLQNSKSDKEKFAILAESIKGFQGTVLRQVQWSNYEFNALHAIDKGAPLGSYEAISKLYYDTVSEYSLDKPKKYKADDQYYSVLVPHFYMGFYVYKYAIGQIVANIFFNRYKKEGKKALQDYIDNFLKAGVYSSPIETLKRAGIDLRDPKVYEEGFAAYEEKQKEYIELGKKIFKVK